MFTGTDQLKTDREPARSAALAPTGRYARQTRLPMIGAAGQRRLAEAKVLLVGCGALGCIIADLLARAGVGNLVIADRDYVELHNLQRQSLFDEADVAAHLPKAEAAAAKLRRANSSVAISAAVIDINASNLQPLAAAADLIVDGTDNFATRYLINDAAVKLGKPWVYGGVLATYGTTMTIVPGVTPCLRCLFPTPPEAGVAPTCDTAGVLGPAVAVIAAIEAAEAIKLAVGDVDAINRSPMTIDLWSLAVDRLRGAMRDPACPACSQRQFTFLDHGLPPRTLVLCGHDAVQIRPDRMVTLDLDDLAQRLQPWGDVLTNEFLLRFRDPAADRELTIFRDGRAIIKGTEDPAEARVLYARFIGN